MRVIPRAKKNGIEGFRDERVLVRVTAPPVDQAANDAVIDVLADALSLPRRAIRLVSGTRRRNKTVEIDGLGREDAIARLRRAFAP